MANTNRKTRQQSKAVVAPAATTASNQSSAGKNNASKQANKRKRDSTEPGTEPDRDKENEELLENPDAAKKRKTVETDTRDQEVESEVPITAAELVKIMERLKYLEGKLGLSHL